MKHYIERIRMITNFYQWFENFCISENIPEQKKNNIEFINFENYCTFEKKESCFPVFEDWWISKPEIIKSKIVSLFGKSETIFARNCKIVKIDKKQSADFLNVNHIYGTCNSKLRLALMYKEEPVSIMTFAGTRKLNSGISGEILRFCNLNYATVTGGLDKLLKAYLKLTPIDNIMTYIDLDWGDGNSFKKLGFNQTGKKKDFFFYANIETGERIPEKYFNDFENLNLYRKIKNSGSLKMIYCL